MTHAIHNAAKSADYGLGKIWKQEVTLVDAILDCLLIPPNWRSRYLLAGSLRRSLTIIKERLPALARLLGVIARLCARRRLWYSVLNYPMPRLPQQAILPLQSHQPMTSPP